MRPAPAIDELNGEGAAPQVPADTLAGEADRIRAAYANRTSPSRYSMFEPAHLLTVQERERKLLRQFAARGLRSTLATARILEVGCGSGTWLREFVRWGARPENMVGIDLLPERIAEARRLCPSAVTLICQSATDPGVLPGGFDLVLQSTVFTSILDPRMKRQLAGQMLRALSPRGLIVWYDFHVNNPANPDVRGIKSREIAELFPGCAIHLEKLTLAPPLGRPVARISRLLYGAASMIKPLCTHYLGIIGKIWPQPNQ